MTDWFDLTLHSWSSINNIAIETGSIQTALRSQLDFLEDWNSLFDNIHTSRWPNYLRLLAVPILDNRGETERAVETLTLFTRAIGIASIIRATQLKPAILFSMKRKAAVTHLYCVAISSQDLITVLVNPRDDDFASQVNYHVEGILLAANSLQSIII